MPSPRKTLLADAWNLPNALTMLRIALIPLVLWFLAQATPQASFWAAMVYIACALTDALDGWLARRKGLVSIVGKFLDPLADKVLVMAVMVWLVGMLRLPKWLAVAILAREFGVSTLRTLAMSERVVIAAGEGGKNKTALQLVGLLFLIVHYRYEVNFVFARTLIDFHELGLAFLYLSLLLALTSAGEYVHLLVQAIERKSQAAPQQAQSPAAPQAKPQVRTPREPQSDA